MRNMPALRTVRNFHDHPGYIKALANNINDYWMKHGRPEKLLMSFHGLPEYTLKKGDPYHCECHKTARLLAERLGLSREQYKLSFQSRFGKAKWLEPYTEPTLIAMARAGVKRVDVVCPGFTSDCLETLEEIALEARAAFLMAGGKEFNYIPCLNDSPEWITALTGIAQQHLAGWPAPLRADDASLAASRAAALALGAKQ
jgi:ferrochelatase